MPAPITVLLKETPSRLRAPVTAILPITALVQVTTVLALLVAPAITAESNIAADFTEEIFLFEAMVK